MRGLTYMRNLKKTKPVETGNRLVVARGGVGAGVGEGGQKVQSSSYRQISSGDLMHSVVAAVNRTSRYS